MEAWETSGRRLSDSGEDVYNLTCAIWSKGPDFLCNKACDVHIIDRHLCFVQFPVGSARFLPGIFSVALWNLSKRINYKSRTGLKFIKMNYYNFKEILWMGLM